MIAWIASAYAQDLVVDGVDLTVSGPQVYDRVIVRNGGRLLVAGVDEAADGGTLSITAALVRVDQGSAIVAVGAGHPGVVNADGLGPAGGGDGARAGAGGSSAGRGTAGWGEGCGPDGLPATGAPDDGPGSAGGGVNGRPGGDGGGVVEIVADRIEIFGTVDVSGDDGADGSGGGAAGRVTLQGDVVRCSGALVARGGSGGGGGGGGTIELRSDSEGPRCPVDVSGGASDCACGGGDGVVVRTLADHDGDGVTRQDGDCSPSDPAVHPGGVESGCNGVDDDCDGRFDEDAASCGGCDRAEAGLGTSWLYCSNLATWSDAGAACAAEGAYTLVTIGDEAENELVWSEVDLRSPPDTDWFIGFDDVAVEGAWGWGSGLPITWAAWGVVGSSQPNDLDGDAAYVGADCAAIGRQGSVWRDLSCDHPSAFVCEVCPERAWYADADGDGWGDELDRVDACAPLVGRADRAGDCDDEDPRVSPGAFETCNGLDDDCDGVLDDADGPVAWFSDRDGDERGDPASLSLATCALPPPEAVALAGDCDDEDDALGPGTVELCDGADQDCDGQIDDDGACVGCTRAVSDHSGSTWQLCELELSWTDARDACAAGDYAFAAIDDPAENERLANLVRASGDDAWFGLSDRGTEGQFEWDDGSPATYEHWDPGQPDDGLTAANQDCVRFWPSEGCFWDDSTCSSLKPFLCEVQCALTERHLDGDGDGYGAGAALQLCDGTPGVVANALDCDDERFTVHPAAPEVPADGVDQDCDGLDRCWTDGDGDGFGGAPADGGCASVGFAARGGDCDDDDPGAYPGATETAGDGVDQDCDCGDVCFADADGDGVGSLEVPVGDTSCGDGDGLVSIGRDCDDADPQNTDLCDDPTTTLPTTGDDDDGFPTPGDPELTSEAGLSGYCGCGSAPASGAVLPALLALLGARRSRTGRRTAR